MMNESLPQPWEEIENLRREKARLEEQNEAMAGILDKVGEKADRHYMRAEEQTELAEQHLEKANTDELTGLLNRHGLKDAFEELMKPSAHETGDRRAVHPDYTVVLLDLDNFKSVNDTYGHAEGDKVLKAAAEYLQSHVRANDKIERYGGEEFLILLSRAEADDIFEKLNGEKFPVVVNDKDGNPVTLEVSFSGGMTSFKPSWGNFKEAVVVADRALYLAKQEGKNKILVAREES